MTWQCNVRRLRWKYFRFIWVSGTSDTLQLIAPGDLEHHSIPRKLPLFINAPSSTFLASISSPPAIHEILYQINFIIPILNQKTHARPSILLLLIHLRPTNPTILIQFPTKLPHRNIPCPIQPYIMSLDTIPRPSTLIRFIPCHVVLPRTPRVQAKCNAI
jgi:hypothetical protein